MGKESGGVRTKTGGIGRDGGGNYKGDIKNIGSLKEIKDTQLRQEIQQGISKFEARLGVRAGRIGLADLNGAYGVATSTEKGNVGVFLDRKAFKNATVADINKVKRLAYKTKFLNATNKPVQHTIIHELSHATWTNHFKTQKAVAAGDEIRKLYKTFLKQNPRSWGSYGKTNINEFYAEGMTKGRLESPTNGQRRSCA